ncbi:TPA: hypothetical protein VDT85_000035 [Pseudomonas aeruginosa]|uniref:hypothetical protein n=1 Tax=Pseudomonas aeruginosa TaxID=287 RepID=UPI00106859CE|nr:hypothetical protein [Pseudomonas aeruginosa]ELM7151859.1 hypothetical protein [Pseudomonas aeruginosa]MBI7362438.1 hypothetical protein [Pseudomonas aeruginosa]NPS66250.1 hypothetical protein [Pseudomonas aeruginosa]TEE62280.1 hypothetical protein IPC1499_17380 [Pseudomonas aeruginosa]HEJ1392262.1 hypothetical protein [Pseudomonas aeruginosa]
MKNITVIYKHMNFKVGGGGFGKLSKSLSHSLRITPPENSTKNLEWDDSKSHLNKIWFRGLEGFKNLDSFSDNQKEAVKKKLLGSIKEQHSENRSKSEVRDEFLKYKAKINKWFNSEQDDGLKVFLQGALEKESAFDVEQELEQLNGFDFKRKSQKTSTFQKFMDLHNGMVDNKAELTRQKTFMQEAFFKIPTRNGVTVPQKDLVKVVSSFYNQNFPDYPVRLIVFHGDEHGDHPHVFIDGKNSKTGKYDLLKAQKDFVNKNIEAVQKDIPEAEVLDFKERSYSKKKLQAQYFQTLFYQHANQILEKHGVEAKKLDKTEEHNRRMRRIEEDASKPKIEREASFWNKKIIDLEEQVEQLEVDKRILAKENLDSKEQLEQVKFAVKVQEDKLGYITSKLDKFKYTAGQYVKSFIDKLKVEVQEFYRREAVDLYDQIEPEHKPEADKTIDELSGFLSPEHASKVRAIKLKR